MTSPTPGEATKQALRLQQYSLAAGAYLLILVPLAVGHAFGFIDGAPALGLAAAIVCLNAGLYAAFRTGFNLRFADPSLTALQVYAAITVLMAALYHANVGRGLAAGLCFLIFLFGVFRLSTRQFVRLTLYALGAYALVINLLMHLKPEAIDSVYHEWFNWLLLGISLPWFAVVAGRVSALRERLRGRNLELQQAVSQIQAMATRDETTGLYNRGFFVESLRHALAQAGRHGRCLALLFIDVDRFKLVNDTLGHRAGDRLLRELGARIAGCVRESDIVARLGGDEFVVLIEGLRSREALHELAQKIVRAASQPLHLESRELALSVSIGVTVSPDDGSAEQELMRNADVAMYRAKALGRNAYFFYTPELDADANERLTLAAELARAVERGELMLLYQPKARVRDGEIVGAEALLRWRHPRHGLIGPERFIGLAEETGAIVAIGRWVLHEACRSAAAWNRRRGTTLSVAVNLSARQFADAALPDDIDAALEGSGLEPSALDLEITESMVMSEPQKAVALMQRLRARGVRISMDDFGTGYSSLGYLKRFPVSTLKIDASFVRGLPGSEDDAAIARSVLAMAHALRLGVVAEGVERAEQLDFLRAEQCVEYQGFLCSRPVPEEAFLSLLDPAAARAA
ncbi:MAG: putative bifunctional diguanylate cyclase/phosphodiesterase [Betaproteobacteria bacterium]